MVTWQIDEFTLTTFHLRASFHRDLIDCMTPWFRLATDLRRAIYLNATDKSRKDQWTWMNRYQTMLMEKRGESARFLPKEEDRPNARRSPARTPEADIDPGAAIVEFDPE